MPEPDGGIRFQSNTRHGFFITFEGGEGCGKTTQMNLFCGWLEESGYRINVTREPGGTLIGEQIRDILLRTTNAAMAPVTEALLLAASRAQLVRDFIEPALARKEVVVSDRYADASRAYQGYGRRIPLPTVDMLIALATGGRRPDLTFLLDISPEESLRRAHLRDRQLRLEGIEDRFEREEMAFHNRVHQGYRELADRDPDRFVVVDGAQPIGVIQDRLREIFSTRYGAIEGSGVTDVGSGGRTQGT
ncbi:dTMP kinase [bacterium]|nr:dTMP kinase [candidate division CSSED10-310 bacterium]